VNDERRLELERYFDGELHLDRHAEIARLVSEDGETRLYLRRLARLRDLARSHELAAGRPASRVLTPPPPRSRAPRGPVVAAAALAAGVALMVVWRIRTAPEGPGAATSVAPAPIVVPFERPASIPEVELYTWANRSRRRPEAAASAILFSGARSGKRPAAAEVLALDLANAAPGLAEELEPLLLLHKSPRGSRGRTERHARRPRPAAPRT
jgi:hypothetical protein